MTSLLVFGFLLGMRHAVEADHVAAVATLVRDSNNLRASIKHGAIWGLGHAITLFLFGCAVIIFGGAISQELAQWLEFAVGLLLVGLGVEVLWRVIHQRIHFHVHQHAESAPHFHAHSHADSVQHDETAHRHQHKPVFPKRTFIVGLMHGMAGASALILLTASQFHTPLMSLLYITLFGLGSMMGMAVLSVAIAWPLRRSATMMTNLNKGVQYALGIFTILLGANVMFSNAV